MRKLTVYFDYSCPYCQRAHKLLMSLLAQHEDIAVDWRAIEAHPRPEPWPRYSDLCVQALLFAKDAGADLALFHQRMYDAIFEDGLDFENPAALAAALAGIVPGEALEAAFVEGRYKQQAAAANDEAYDHAGVWAVPALRMEGHRLDAVENVGVTGEQLAAFLQPLQ